MAVTNNSAQIYTTGNITLSNSQIKNIFTSPVTVIAAPGAGKIIIPLVLTVKFNYGGNNAFITGGNLNGYVGSKTGTNVFAINSGVYTGTTDAVFGYGTNIGQSGPFTQNQNQPVILATATLDPTGNAANDNTMTVNLIYTIITM